MSGPRTVIACGALAAESRAIARRRGWEIDVHPMPALLHNRPERIAPALERCYRDAAIGRYDAVAVAYARLRELRRDRRGCSSRARHRRASTASTATTCSRATRSRAALAEQPGTYFLTDFLARTFEHTVVRELGLDRHPELRDDYFRNYTRVLWLAQRPTPATRAAAERAAARIGLPLDERAVGNGGLERSSSALLDAPAAEQAAVSVARA